MITTKKYYSSTKIIVVVHSDITMEMRIAVEKYWSLLWKKITKKPMVFKRAKNLNTSQSLSDVQLDAIGRAQT